VHLAQWFAEQDECPTGCGCCCVFAGNAFYREVLRMQAEEHQSADATSSNLSSPTRRDL
jgi:hypothetical protein